MMDSRDAEIQSEPLWGMLREESVQSEGDHTQEVESQLSSQMEETEAGANADNDSNLQLMDTTEGQVIPLKAAPENLMGQPEELDNLGAQFEQCLRELEALFVGRCGGVDAQIGGCLEAMSAQLEGCTRGLALRLGSPLEMDGSVSGPRPVSPASLHELGLRFEGCIAEVSALECRRDELVRELLQLEEPMAVAARELRTELHDGRVQLARAELERRAVRQEAIVVRKRLFATVRESTQSQVAMETLQCDKELSAVIQDELQAELLRLSEEAARLRLEQQNHLNELRSRLGGADVSRAPSELLWCREASQALQQRLQRGTKALQELYEPRIQALQARRQSSAEATMRSREEARELRERLPPLKEEAQGLALRRACLQERMALLHREREENLGQYRDTVESLEENSRKLKTELQVQQRKNKEIEKLTQSLEQEMSLYRSGPGVHRQPDSTFKEET